jgi:hypothetical protein
MCGLRQTHGLLCFCAVNCFTTRLRQCRLERGYVEQLILVVLPCEHRGTLYEMTVVYTTSICELVESCLLRKTHAVGIDWDLAKNAVTISISLVREVVEMLLLLCAVLGWSISSIDGFRLLAPTSLCLLATTSTGARASCILWKP